MGADTSHRQLHVRFLADQGKAEAAEEHAAPALPAYPGDVPLEEVGPASAAEA